MIAGENAGNATSAGPYMRARPKARTLRTATTGQVVPIERADPRRTQERVLRIVFQPYVDERGRLHEASAVHAVVQSGEWRQQAIASATAIPDRNVAMVTKPETLVEAIDRADPLIADAAAIDPNLPDPAVVAAARARSVDPVAAIKSDVAARLAPKTGRNAPVPALVTPKEPAAQARSSVPVSGPASAPVISKSTVPSPAGVTVLPKTTGGVEAAARVKASPQYQARAAGALDTAHSAAAAGVVPAVKPDAKPSVHAADFPASIPQEN